MTKPIPEYLRLHTEPVSVAVPAVKEPIPGLADLCRAFERATGWPLRFLQTNDPHHDANVLWSAALDTVGGPPAGQLQIDRHDDWMDRRACDKESAVGLATSLSQLLHSLLLAQRELVAREADLAAGVPIAPHPSGRSRLPELLSALLQSAAEALGCQSAGLYMLDDATTELKLRAAWQLPDARFTAPPRLLRDSGADLEALSGHAVVLEDASTTIHWKPPEACQSAVCLPLSSATTVLGTLWLYGHTPRNFRDADINVAEVIAGRLATELERETLAVEVRGAKEIRRDLFVAEKSVRDQLPSVAPHCPGWEVAGATELGNRLGGSFHDWFAVGQGDQLAVALGEIEAQGTTAALLAGGLRSSLRAQDAYTDNPARLLDAANRTLWSGSAEGLGASAFCGVIEPGSGLLRYASAGPLGLLHVQRESAGLLLPPSLSLGQDPDASWSEWTLQLSPEELLLVGSDAWRRLFEKYGVDAVAELWRNLTAERHNAPPATLFAAFRRGLEGKDGYDPNCRRSLLMIRHRP